MPEPNRWDEISQAILGRTALNDMNVQFRSGQWVKVYPDLRYDSETSAATTVAATTYTFFDNTSGGAPSLTTNMDIASQFASNCAFLCRGITVDIVDGASGTLLQTADVAAVARGSVFQFTFNSQSPYFTRIVGQLPQSMDPTDYRPRNWMNDQPFWIPPQTNFSAVITVPTAITITTSAKAKWIVSIHGFYVRPVG